MDKGRLECITVGKLPWMYVPQELKIIVLFKNRYSQSTPIPDNSWPSVHAFLFVLGGWGWVVRWYFSVSLSSSASFFISLFQFDWPRKGMELIEASQHTKCLVSVAMVHAAQKVPLMCLSDFSVLRSSFAVQDLTIVQSPELAQALIHQFFRLH